MHIRTECGLGTVFNIFIFKVYIFTWQSLPFHMHMLLDVYGRTSSCPSFHVHLSSLRMLATSTGLPTYALAPCRPSSGRKAWVCWGGRTQWPIALNPVIQDVADERRGGFKV